MELKQLLNNFTKNGFILLGLTLLGTMLGLLYSILPAKYITTGSFFIGRTVETNSGFFTYEGYYAQQTATEYTKTVVGLLESTSIHGKALESLGIKVDEYSLRKYGRSINVKVNGPQLVTLTVKGNDRKSSVDLWKALTSALLQTTEKVNYSNDKSLQINAVASEPVMKLEYKPWYWCIFIGMAIGATLGIIFVASKKYIKEDF